LQQATVWSNGNTTYLNNLPDAYYSEAFAINDAGQAVGIADGRDNQSHAVV
jgi:uncharacterized membrane protein